MFSGRDENPQGVDTAVVASADATGQQGTEGADNGGNAGSVRDGAPGVVETTTRPPLRVRLRTLRIRFALWRQSIRFRLAVWLVRGNDGIVVSNAAFQVALDRLANLAEWADQMKLSRRLYESHSGHVDDITRVLVLAAEIGDYSLQLEGRQERYVNLRYRAMTPRQRERLKYIAALEALERRIGKKPATPTPAPTPEGATA